MILIKEAAKQAYDIVNKQKSNLENSYDKVEYRCEDNGFFLICSIGTNESISLQIIPDYQRKNINVPKSVKDYQNQGGHKGLIEKFADHNPEAWEIKVNVKNSEDRINYEIGFSGNENNWDTNIFEKEMLRIFIKQI